MAPYLTLVAEYENAILGIFFTKAILTVLSK